jgi:hypothetical protein
MDELIMYEAEKRGKHMQMHRYAFCFLFCPMLGFGVWGLGRPVLCTGVPFVFYMKIFSISLSVSFLGLFCPYSRSLLTLTVGLFDTCA